MPQAPLSNGRAPNIHENPGSLKLSKGNSKAADPSNGDEMLVVHSGRVRYAQ